MTLYPVTLTPDDGQVMVTFTDFPEAVTCGKDEEEALQGAIDCLEEVVAARITDREPIPVPSQPQAGQRLVALPLNTAVKALIWSTMQSQNIRKADLARRLDWDQKQVDRLLDPHHPSKPEIVEAALAALGKRFRLELADAA